MIIHEIKIDGFGRHCGLKLELSGGVNVLWGENESGKSTAAAFIRAMLYGLSGRGVQSERRKYMPWQSGAKYGGELKFEHKGIFYRISARFGESKRDDKVTLYNDTTGEIIPVEASKTIGEAILEIPPETYDLSVYAAQLSSRPDLDNGNMDYLFDQLVKKSDSMKQSSSDIVVGKRLKSAMDQISSPRNDKGTLDYLQNKKSEADIAIKKIYSMEAEAESLRQEHARLEEELKDIKDRHKSEKNNMDKITDAISIMALHKNIKNCISMINSCDEELMRAVSKRHRIQKTAVIILAVLLLICGAGACALIFSSRLTGLDFLQRLMLYRAAVENKTMAYFYIIISALVLLIIFSIITYISGDNARAYKEELFELESELCDVLGIDYEYGAKYHSYNRDNINAALERHSKEYKEARAVLDSEKNKELKDKEFVDTVEEYTKRIASAGASADALSKAAEDIGDCEDLMARSAELAESIDIYKKRYEALAIARSVLEEAYARWQADLGPVFGNEAGDILSMLTGGRYNDVRVARNFDITMRSEEGVMQSSYVYSGATIDQMYLALRLALVKIISPTGSMLPLVLDDPFVQYDEKRRAQAYNVVKNFTGENNSQIILTACRKDNFPEEFNVIELAV